MLLALLGTVLLALYVVPGGWGWALVAAAVGLTALELVLIRSTRAMPPRAGAKSMIGGNAVVVSRCDPVGRVRCGRESWRARCNPGTEADVGETVVIEAIESLTLIVSPTADG